MISYFKRSRLLICVVLFALYACTENDLSVKPTPPSPREPELPACGKKAFYGFTGRTSYFAGDVVEVFLQSDTIMECGIKLYDVSGKVVYTSGASLFPQVVSTSAPWMNGFGFTFNGKITLPPTLASGVYFFENKIPLVVKSNRPSDVTVVYPSNTINAYNPSGGKSLYGYNSTDLIAAIGVSYLRPLIDRGDEYRCIECLKWFPALHGLTINYISDLDLDNFSSIANTKVLVIAGHSEYWTRAARTNFDQFVDGGGHSVLLSGNSMWWQVRYNTDRNEVICYKSIVNDPETDPLMKTTLWTDVSLNYSIIGSIGSDFDHGGYGLKSDNGWNGFKIANGASPLLEGLNLKRGDIVSMPSGECDGAPISGFDADGFPILDNQFNFSKLELIGFDRGFRVKETFPTFIALQRKPTSGIIVNMGANDWCSGAGIGNASTGRPIKTITYNAIQKLVSGRTIFSN